MKEKKIICRLRGGIGNQMFIYAASRFLSIKLKMDLVLDNESGFKRDYLYSRKYQLHNFKISTKIASNIEKLEPFERFRRALIKNLSFLPTFFKRYEYFIEKTYPLDEQFFKLNNRCNIIIDGYFQNELYFIEISDIIRKDFNFKLNLDNTNNLIYKNIISTNSVAIHYRNFEKINESNISNLSLEYYLKGISLIKEKYDNLFFFLFSDSEIDVKFFGLNNTNCFFVNNNSKEGDEYLDLYLMSKCKHLIISNSTFSWWSAWLCENRDKMIIAPQKNIDSNTKNESILPIIPYNWLQIK